MKRVTGDYVLCVDDVTVKVKDANILQDIRFTARTGDLLAILGPTGMSSCNSSLLYKKYNIPCKHATLELHDLGICRH